ncbi:MAG: GNAT family N-acetyltransferase [Bacteriovoracaceae bacterium]|nr:GNAT family N-acetyltransferase [Bacteriovoracaceae bacterium]
MSQTPSIESSRLKLTPFEIHHFNESHKMWNEPKVYEFISGEPSSVQKSWSRLLMQKGMWELKGYGYWALIDKATGAYAGEVGFGDFKREMTPPLFGIPEMGWIINPNFHSKGYATEATQAVLNWAIENKIGNEFFCIIDPRNLASIRISEKLGFKKSHSAKFMGQDINVYQKTLVP